MKPRRSIWIIFVPAAFVSLVLPATVGTGSWNPRGAARFLDQRADWWKAWPAAARDHQTFCVSCHTAIPYALSRPSLRAALGEQSPSAGERDLRENVIKRVRLWNEVAPYYPGQDRQSRGTEAVVNAVVLASLDAATGRLSDDTRAAFDAMWALQEASGPNKGAWPWINFHNEPWEATDSPFFGACLAAIAVGTVPGNYQDETKVQSQIALLREYLTDSYPRQSLLNQAFLLWASAEVHGLLSGEQQRTIANDLLNAQRADGGWTISSIGWSWRATQFSSLSKMWRSDASPWNTRSDGLATSVVLIALEQSGLAPNDQRLERGLAWLSHNQTADGAWRAGSLNKHREPTPGPGLFMTDAATAFAALALAGAR